MCQTLYDTQAFRRGICYGRSHHRRLLENARGRNCNANPVFALAVISLAAMFRLRAVDRLIAVGHHSRTLANIKSLDDLAPDTMDQLIAFFEQYNKLEEKEFRCTGSSTAEGAKALVEKGSKPFARNADASGARIRVCGGRPDVLSEMRRAHGPVRFSSRRDRACSATRGYSPSCLPIATQDEVTHAGKNCVRPSTV